MKPNPSYIKAAYFAAVKHTGQLRKNAKSEPYINHPLQVANLIAESGVDDPAILCAAVLHDTLEDTQTTEEQLREQFGEEVLKIVEECSDDKSLDKVVRKVNQIQHTKHVSQKAKIVKLADKLSNVTSLSQPPKGWSQERVRGYVLWSHEVCQNMSGVNQQLENALHKIFEEYKILGLNEEEKKKVLEGYYDSLRASKQK